MNDAMLVAGALVTQDATGKWVPRPDQMTSKDSTCTYLGQQGRAKCNVLESMGLALHAAQDFYSHSNWGDQADPNQPLSRSNPPGLNKFGPSAWLDPYNAMTSDFPDGLITGCYAGFPEALNCNYSLFKSRVKHAYLNKDGVGKDRSKINGNYEKVIAMASQDTRDKWHWLETSILGFYPGQKGAAIVCGLRHDSATSCQ